jgi:hypothetical protein
MVASLPLLNFDPAIIGFDAVVEFPPTGMTPQVLKRALNGHRSRLHLPIRLSDFQLLAGRSRSECTDTAYDYPTYVDVMTHQRHPEYTYFPGVFPSWDDSTTHATGACMFQNSTPNWYGRWLHHAITMARLMLTGDEQLVFINSWNDWAVLSQLEPDQRWNRQYLQMTQGVLASFADSQGGS